MSRVAKRHLQFYLTASGELVRMDTRVDGELGGGGEAVVVKCHQKGYEGLAAKIYRQEFLRQLGETGRESLKHKLEYITDMAVKGKLQIEGVSLPRQMLFDANGQMAGFLMPQVEGAPLHRNLMNSNWLHRNNWDRRDIADFILAMLRRFSLLHSNGILMGDVNRRNLLYHGNRDHKDCLMVDADSYQYTTTVSDAPKHVFFCPGGIPDYLHPDLLDTSGPEARLRSDITTKERTVEHECYSVAVVCFELLMAGQISPFDYCDPDYHWDWRQPAPRYERRFVYPMLTGSASLIPKTGPWQYVWFHLPDYLRQAFSTTFRDLTPPTIDEWQQLFGRYADGLGSNRYPREILPPEECYRPDTKSILLPMRDIDPQTDSHLLPSLTDDGQGLAVVEIGSKWVSPLVSMEPIKAAAAAETRLDQFASTSSNTPMTLSEHLTPEGSLETGMVSGQLVPSIEWLIGHGLQASIETLEKRYGRTWPYASRPRLYIYGTAFLRNLKNRDEVVEQCRQMTGLPIGIISQQAEAEAILLASTHSLPLPEGQLVAAELTATQLTIGYRQADGQTGGSVLGLGIELAQELLFTRAGDSAGLRQALTTIDSYVDALLREELEALPWLKGHSAPWMLTMAGSAFGNQKTRSSGNSEMQKLVGDRRTLHGVVATAGQLQAMIDQETDSLTSWRNDVAALKQNLEQWNDSYQDKLRTSLERRISLQVCMAMMRLLEADSVTFSTARCKHGIYFRLRDQLAAGETKE